MEQFRPLGRRDIFGILLPGAVVVFAAVYVLFGMLTSLQLSVKGLLDQQFLLAVVLLIAAYLVGSLLRLYAADDVDKKSSEYLVEVWRKEHRAQIESGCIDDFEKYKAVLARGEDISGIPDGFDGRLFDEWLSQVDRFPYHARLNRVWSIYGFHEILNFFRCKYKASMWPEERTYSKRFLNYCKWAIIGNGGSLADEVNMAEGQTRFFAGTVVALQLSVWMLSASLIVQSLLVAALTLVPRWGISVALPVQWTFQGFYLVLTLVLMLVSQWMRRQIMRRFRGMRFKEAENVYFAFYYICSMPHSDRAAKKDQAVLRALPM